MKAAMNFRRPVIRAIRLPERGLVLGLVVLLGVRDGAKGSDPIAVTVPQRSAPVSFERDIAPILRANCLACHHAKKASGGLNLESAQSILKGGESGASVVAGNGDGSLLLKVAAHQRDPVMPPADNTVAARPLSSEQLGLLKLWIDQGATGDLSTRQIQWQMLPRGYQPALASAVTRDGQCVAFSRGNRILIQHGPTGRLMTMLVDPQFRKSPESNDESAHRDLVRSLAFNPAGDLLASSAYREVKIWRRPRIERIAELGQESAIQLMSVSSNGKWLATGDDSGGLRFFDLSTRQLLSSWVGHTSAVTAMAFSGDGQTLCSAGADKSLQIWSAADGQPLKPRVETVSPIRTMSFLSDNDWLVAGCDDGMIRVWDLKSIREAPGIPGPVKEMKAHAGAVTSTVAVPGEGRQFLSAGIDGLVRRWDADSGKPIAEFKHESPVSGVAISPDRRRLVSVSSQQVALWSEDGKRLAVFVEDPRQVSGLARLDAQIAFTKSAISLAQQDLKSYEGLIRIAKVRMEEIKKAEEELVKVQKSRDEKKAALDKVKAENGKTEPAEKALADAETAVVVAGTVIDRAKAISERTSKELADAEQAVNAREEHLKQQEAEKQAAMAASKQQVLGGRSVNFTSEGGQFVVGCESGLIHVYDSEAGHWSQTLTDHQGAVSALHGGTGGLLISASLDRRAILWNASAEWRLERTLGGTSHPDAFVDRVLCVDFNRDGTQLATSGGVPSRIGEVKTWRVDTGELIKDFHNLHSETVFAVRFSPASDHLASAAGDRLIRVVDTGSGQIVQTMAGHTGYVQTLSWKSDGRQLVSGGADQVLKLWDVATGVPVRTMKGTTYKIGAYKRDITSVAFVGDSEQILAASGDGTVRMHRTTSDNDILTFADSRGYQHSVSVTPDGRTVVSTGADGTVRVWSGHESQPKRSFIP